MFVTEKPTLFAALSIAKGAVNDKDLIPLLTHVLFDRDGDHMTITGTNLDQQICAKFSAEIGREFEAFACPASLLVNVVKHLGDGFDIRVEAVRSGGKLSDIRIRAGTFHTKLPVLAGADFPALSSAKLPHQLSLNASSLLRALKTVEYAAETNEQRPGLCGVRLDMEDDGIAVVSTNANRLAKHFLQAAEFDGDLFGIPSVTVPSAAVQTIMKLLEKQEDVAIELSEDVIRVQSGDVVLTSKLIDMPFLNYKAVSASSDGITAEVSAKMLAAAVARVLTVNDDKSSGVGFEFFHDKIIVSSRANGSGEADDTVPAVCSGELRQGFNGKFMIAALDHIDRDQIEMLVGEDRTPTIIRPQGEKRTEMILGAIYIAGFTSVRVPEEQAA